MLGTPPPELTEEQLTARLREFDEWGRVRGQAPRQPTDDGLNGSIKGSTVDILGENWREQEQTPIPKHEPVAKERPIRRLYNPQSARDELESIMDGRIYHLDFPETPMRYVGMTASCVTAIRDEPGRTLIRQYMMPRLKNQRGNPLARVDTEAGFVARFLFEENPKAAKKRLVEFLEETCDGKHDVPEVTEIIKQFEPFDIKLSTLVRMLDAIFEQGNSHAAQICQLRTDNRKQATMIAAQGEQLAVQGEQLTNVLEQNKENKEKLSVQGSKIDQLLSMMRPDEGAAGGGGHPNRQSRRNQEHRSTHKKRCQEIAPKIAPNAQLIGRHCGSPRVTRCCNTLCLEPMLHLPIVSVPMWSPQPVRKPTLQSLSLHLEKRLRNSG